MGENEEKFNPDKPKRDKLVVEIGSGGIPSFISGNRVVATDERYETVNEDEYAVKVDSAYTRDRPNTKSILGDARKLPYGDGTVDEVLMSNVLSDNKTAKPEEILKEATRVLSVTGKIILTEIYSPTAFPKSLVRVDEDGTLHVNDTGFSAYGLKVESISQDQKDISLVQRYPQDSRGFILVLKKIV